MPIHRAGPLLLLAAVSSLVAAWSVREPERPNVILITVDTLRADRLSCYGYEKHRTPNFDRLAEEGVLFEHAFCDVTWTTPSMASVMTGQYAPTHGMQSSYQRLKRGAATLAERLRGRGIHTAAIIGSYPLDSIFGLDQGFELYDDTFSAPLFFPPGVPVEQRRQEALKHVPSRFEDNLGEMQLFLRDKAAHDAYRPDNEVSDRAIRWLVEERREPFFLWLHYLGPHEKPHNVADIFEGRKMQLAEYDPDVVIADAQVGRVLAELDTLGLGARTAVILHADHGQSLLEHNYFGHGRYLYDDTQRVPMIMRLAGRVPAGVRIERPVRNLDIFATVLDLVGLAPRAPVESRSLLPLVQGLPLDSREEETYVETYLSTNRLFADVIDAKWGIRLGFRRMGIRTPRWKLIVNDPVPFGDDADPAPVSDEMHTRFYSVELYDLVVDPGELTNVIGQHRDFATTLVRKVWEHQPRTAPASEAMPMSDATRERLRALGYLAD